MTYSSCIWLLVVGILGVSITLFLFWQRLRRIRQHPADAELVNHLLRVETLIIQEICTSRSGRINFRFSAKSFEGRYTEVKQLLSSGEVAYSSRQLTVKVYGRPGEFAARLENERAIELKMGHTDFVPISPNGNKQCGSLRLPWLVMQNLTIVQDAAVVASRSVFNY
jgi:hypothetical protein